MRRTMHVLLLASGGLRCTFTFPLKQLAFPDNLPRTATRLEQPDLHLNPRLKTYGVTAPALKVAPCPPWRRCLL